MITRLMLGAERTRLIRQLLTETLLLAAAGGLLGLGLSKALGPWVQILLPEPAGAGPFLLPASVALVVGLVALVTLLSGIAPAFITTGVDLNTSLRAGDGVSTGTKRRFTTHECFAAAQLVLAMILLTCTALLLRSIVARLGVSLAFDPTGVAIVSIPRLTPDAAPWKRYEQQNGKTKWGSRNYMEGLQRALDPIKEAEAARHELFYAEAKRRLSELPGVLSVAVMDTPPFSKGSFDLVARRVLYEHSGRKAEIVARGVLFRHVSSDAFRLLGTSFLAGRGFSPEDVPGPDSWKYETFDYAEWSDVPAPVSAAVVNETLARRLWPNQSAIGRMLYDPSPMRVIGVVKDIHESRTQLDTLPTVYRLFEGRAPLVRASAFVIKLKPGASAASLSAGVERATAALLRGEPAPSVSPLDEPLGNLRVALGLLGCFSLLGTMVASLGVYATSALMITARTREIGIRRALGAPAERIATMVLWRGVRIVLFAIPGGAFGAWVLGVNLSHWLFQVGATDPASYAASATILLVVALAAGVWPALRAIAIGPADAIRDS